MNDNIDFSKATKTPVFSDSQLHNFSEIMNKPEYQNYIHSQMSDMIRENLGTNNPMQSPKNLMVEEQKKLNTQVKQLESKISAIQYENMKLNAQIETLNNTIDSNNKKLDELRNTNTKLEIVNKTLKDNNKHYWLFTTIIGVCCAAFGVILGHYF